MKTTYVEYVELRIFSCISLRIFCLDLALGDLSFCWLPGNPMVAMSGKQVVFHLRTVQTIICDCLILFLRITSFLQLLFDEFSYFMTCQIPNWLKLLFLIYTVICSNNFQFSFMFQNDSFSCPMPLSLLQCIGEDQVRLPGLWRLRQWQCRDASHGGVSRGAVLSDAVPARWGRVWALSWMRLEKLGTPEAGHPELAAATLQEQHRRRWGRHFRRGLSNYGVWSGDVGAGEESCGWGPAVCRTLSPPRQGRISP